MHNSPLGNIIGLSRETWFWRTSFSLNVWTDVDWQAIGTWFTGVALAIFAYMTWKIQREQHNILFGGTRLQVDYSEAIVSQSGNQRSFWVHVQVVNRNSTPNSVVECNWLLQVHQETGPTIQLVLPSQSFSDLTPRQLPQNVKGLFLCPPFRIDAFGTIDGWLHRCISDETINQRAPDKVSLIFIDSTGSQQSLYLTHTFPLEGIEVHTH